jgi:hypothetical protein
MKYNALEIETDSLLNVQQLTNNETTKLTINNDSTNVNQRHSLETLL